MTDHGARPPEGDSHEGAELTCEESLARVYEYLDGELDAAEHDAVHGHLERCRACYPHFDFERLFLDYVHELGAAETPNPGLANRVRELIAAEPA